MTFPENCFACPRHCGVNRTQGQTGFCRIGGNCTVSHIGLHFGEEPPISGTRGSGAIFFTGCNLRCVFCQNHQISQQHQQTTPKDLTPQQLAEAMIDLQNQGAHNINAVSPSHMAYQLAETIRRARDAGLVIPVVYNSNGYDDVQMLRQLSGLIDIYLPDCKYADNALAERFSSAPGYAELIPHVLDEMLRQAGHLETDEEGIATRGLLVRHLILPGCAENSKGCLKMLAHLSKLLTISLMSQYTPQYRAKEFPPLDRPLWLTEYEEILDYAEDLGLENIFTQELESQEEYLPDFAKQSPFSR